MNRQLPTLEDTAILALTKDGEQELREPGTMLSTPELEALVLVGGSASVGQIIKRGRRIPPDVLRSSLSELVDKNLVSVNSKTGLEMIDPGDFFSSAAPAASRLELGEQSHPTVDSDAEFLRQNGYFVTLVRKPSAQHDHAKGRRLSVLIIEDDPDICKLLQICLKLEGMDTRTAANRADVVGAFRVAPLPDLVLLDVRLPDVSGFDILARMRDNQVLREIPVVILTAVATREAVLNGLLGGADGFVTKPFQIDNLLKAVKTVLGLEQNPKN
jgi:two-component system OmpR family response regulator